MNGFISRTLVAMGLGGAIVASGGCAAYRDCVDPCGWQRYAFMARQETQACFDPQVGNGHVLDQTVWNYHFDAGTDQLTPAGMLHLAYIARRRPSPDPMVWLQTAQDVAYDPAAPEKFSQARGDLDQKRIVAVKKYLTAQTAGRPVPFEVNVHDPAEVGTNARLIERALNVMENSYNQPYRRQSTALTTGSGGGGGGGGGAMTSGGG
jgi:hypothetical protein